MNFKEGVLSEGTISGSFEFHELREALSYLREARHFGKVCLRA